MLISQGDHREEAWVGTFLVAQWLRIHTSNAGVQCLVGELKSHMLTGS